MEQLAAGDVRILFLSRGGELDGAQRQLLYLADQMRQLHTAGRGRRFVPLVVLDEPGPFSEELQRVGLAVHVTPMRYWRRFPEALFRYVDAWRLTSWARAQGIGLVHASDLWKTAYGLFVGRQLGVPCVAHVRGPLTPRDMAKHRLNQAAAIIAIARRYVDDMTAAGMRFERLHEIDDSVDLHRFTRNEAEREQLRAHWQIGKHVAVGLVGRLEPFKKVGEFLEAVGRLPAAVRARARFFLIGQAGSDRYMAQLHAAVHRLGLSSCVIFQGRRADIATVLSALDVLATLSGGSVIFEAMACGTTVLSARSDGRHAIHTRHDETAWCIDSVEPGALAAALQRLICDAHLRLRLGAAGAAWARAHLSAACMAEKTAAVYESLLPAGSGASRR